MSSRPKEVNASDDSRKSSGGFAARQMTIVEAIQCVLKEASEALTVEELYSRIVERSLYDFRAADPKSVVRSQVRRHTLGLEFPSASPVKYFRVIGGDRMRSNQRLESVPHNSEVQVPNADRVPEEIIGDAYREHLILLRQQLKERILANHPAFFRTVGNRVVVKNGYGGNDPSLGIHTGGPGRRRHRRYH
jgi:restriction system protein